MLEPFLGKSQYANHGQRVVEGQRLMQAASDIMLGWERSTGPDGVKRGLLHPPAVGQEGLGAHRGMKPRRARRYAEICGRTLARAHARSGDAVAIAAYLGTGDALDQALADFAELYADQNERDYAAGRRRQARKGQSEDRAQRGRRTFWRSRHGDREVIKDMHHDTAPGPVMARSGAGGGSPW